MSATARERQIDNDQKIPIPRWTWVFAGLCLLIPLLTLGGAIPGSIAGNGWIPGGIGVGGVIGCMILSRNRRRSVGVCVIQCIAITAVCWILFAAFLVVWSFILMGRS